VHVDNQQEVEKDVKGQHLGLVAVVCNGHCLNKILLLVVALRVELEVQMHEAILFS
jgi:hypothetical protein